MSEDFLHTNHLISEKSPYLLQHAHNPIEWYPWSEEAFSKALAEGKPIFLSIGYATCHWCHVMEEESFRDEELAHLMNDTFINIKVDREERPEIDSLYMEFAQAIMSGGAGWPLNMVLTPELMPFFAATYLPADSTRGFLGMKQLVARVRQIWEDPAEREHVIMQAGKIVDVFASEPESQLDEIPTREQITEATELLFKSADPVYGGMKGSPKFPIGFQASFLLREAQLKGDSRALFYVERTLEMMHRGGIYDHLGGGFARYSIDEQWMVPHFEKMLYDNAILGKTYIEAWEYTRQNYYKEVAQHILDYVVRELCDPQGFFYSAEDADVQGEEGEFYTWRFDEIQRVLNRDAALFCEFYGVTPGGNFKGRNVLHMPHSVQEFADHRRLDTVVLTNMLKQQKDKLFLVRKEREHPVKDDKVITSYNALMIDAFCRGYAAFRKKDLLDVAKKAADFIHDHLMKEGALYRRWRDGEAKHDACLDDFAFLIQALLTLFENDAGAHYLEFAFSLLNVVETEFKAESGAYYLTNGKDPHLLIRRCEFYDGAEPSANAVMAENLLRLYQMTKDTDYKESAEAIFKAAKEHIDLYPPGACYHLMVLMRYYDEKAPTFVVALNENEDLKEEIATLINGFFLPHKTVVWKRESDEQIRDLVPEVRSKKSVDGKTALYICFPNRCSAPLTDLSSMQQMLETI